MKKVCSAILAVILLFALTVPAGAAATSFSDVTDTALARDIAVLQMLGAVSGDGSGNFIPDGTLTRAAFCKMAVIVLGKGDQEALFKTRTIFPDVRAGHWARGFINYAVAGEKKFIVGNSDGTFRPEDPITNAQAIAIAMRLLGYTDSDAGMIWPDGYLTLAADKGVSAGLNVTATNAPMSRAAAGHLFCNLLGANVKGGAGYLSTIGTPTADAVIMQLNVTADDGTGGAVRTSDGVLKTATGVVPPAILGLRGTLLKDSLGRLLTFLPDKKSQRTVAAKSAEAGFIIDISGTTHTIQSTVTAFTASEITTYGTAFIDITPGMQVTLFYSTNGKVDGVYINTSKSDTAVVIGLDGSISTLTGGDTGYSIVKNGAPATVADIRPNDVATYSASAKILYLSDFRLTGCYENCWPSMSFPSKLTLMGHEFEVLPSAVTSLTNYRVGQTITLLLTSDLQVAGAVTNGVTGSTAIGIVQPGVTATSASVKLLNGLVVSGNPALTGNAESQLAGELVTVTSLGAGWISLSLLGNSGVSANLNLTNRTLGNVALSSAIKVFERVGSSSITQISLSDLTHSFINASKIIYAGKDSSGLVDTLVLNDVTGDRYTYGLLVWGDNSVSVINSENLAGTGAVYITGIAYSTKPYIGGVVVTADGDSAVGFMPLTAVSNVKRTSFYVNSGVIYVSVNGMDFPVASNVQCYNSLGKTWFASLSDARAFSDTLTVYYDRTASEGGKIRMVVVG